jgi:hypothetical protein
VTPVVVATIALLGPEVSAAGTAHPPDDDGTPCLRLHAATSGLQWLWRKLRLLAGFCCCLLQAPIGLNLPRCRHLLGHLLQTMCGCSLACCWGCCNCCGWCGCWC